LGCDPAALPPDRPTWAALAFPEEAAPPEALADADAPAVPTASDRLYHGGAFDLSKAELGAFLRDYQQKGWLAPRVVLRLSGAGEHDLTPFALKGVSLVLYFEPPAHDGDAPPALRLAGRDPVGQEALIDIQDGNLDIINGDLRLADFPHAAAPAYLLRVRGGDLRLFRTRLEGPVLYAADADAFRALIDVEGAGAGAGKAGGCAANECVLLSGRDGVRVHGNGARLLLRQTVLVAAGDALRLEPAPDDKGRANLHCLLEHATVAGRKAVIGLGDAPAAAPPGGPAVVRARDCAFLAPFADKSGRSGMLAYDQAALAHGLFLWQGDGNAYDKRLHFAAAPAKAPPEQPQEESAWGRLWGSAGERHAADVTLPKPFDGDRWQGELDRLALPKKGPAPPDGRTPGADLALLGVVKKPAKPPK